MGHNSGAGNAGMSGGGLFTGRGGSAGGMGHGGLDSIPVLNSSRGGRPQTDALGGLGLGGGLGAGLMGNHGNHDFSSGPHSNSGRGKINLM